MEAMNHQTHQAIYQPYQFKNPCRNETFSNEIIGSSLQRDTMLVDG